VRKLNLLIQPSHPATTTTVLILRRSLLLRSAINSAIQSLLTIRRLLFFSPVLSTQVCGGVLGSGILTSTPASGVSVTGGVMDLYCNELFSGGIYQKYAPLLRVFTSALSNTITVAIAPDTTRRQRWPILPSPVLSNSAMTVSWTAPGDDGLTWTANSYDLRYSTSAITSENFGSATQVTGEPAPSVALSLESMTVTVWRP